MLNKLDESIPRHGEGEPATQTDSYSDSVKIDALKEHNRREATSHSAFGGDKLARANAAKNILHREIVLRGHSVEVAADRCGMSTTRLQSLIDGWSTIVSPQEAAALEKYTFGLTPDLLLADNTDNNVARTSGRF